MLRLTTAFRVLWSQLEETASKFAAYAEQADASTVV